MSLELEDVRGLAAMPSAKRILEEADRLHRISKKTNQELDTAMRNMDAALEDLAIAQSIDRPHWAWPGHGRGWSWASRAMSTLRAQAICSMGTVDRLGDPQILEDQSEHVQTVIAAVDSAPRDWWLGVQIPRDPDERTVQEITNTVGPQRCGLGRCRPTVPDSPPIRHK